MTTDKPSDHRQAQMLSRYDRGITAPIHRMYFGYSDFYNYGYWGDGAQTQSEACEALVTKLLSFIPEKTGTILDVACGLGASTKMLLDHYPAENIVGINLSEYQLGLAGRNAPGVRFIRMDATALEFPDSSFSNVICVEASHHFNPREAFYREALRVLEPGGRLVSSDLGGPNWAYAASPPRNAVELKRDLEAAGFSNVETTDQVKETWRGFRRNLKRFAVREHKNGTIDRWQYAYLRLASALTPIMSFGIRHYMLTVAQKPLASEPVADTQSKANASSDGDDAMDRKPKES